MNKIFLSAMITGTIFFMSCGQTNDAVAKQKAELQKLKDQQAVVAARFQVRARGVAECADRREE